MSDLPAPPSFKSKIIQIKPHTDADYYGTGACNSGGKKNEGNGTKPKRLRNTGKKRRATDDDDIDDNDDAGFSATDNGNGTVKNHKELTSPSHSKKQKISKQQQKKLANQKKKDHKTAHSIIEKKRRTKLNREFEALKIMVPACRNSIINTNGPNATAINDGMYKLTILQATVEYINYLHKVIRIMTQSQLPVHTAAATDRTNSIDGQTNENGKNISFAKLSLNLDNYRNLDHDFNFTEIMKVFKLMSNYKRSTTKNKSKQLATNEHGSVSPSSANSSSSNESSNSYLVADEGFDKYLQSKGIKQEIIDNFHLFFEIADFQPVPSTGLQNPIEQTKNYISTTQMDNLPSSTDYANNNNAINITNNSPGGNFSRTSSSVITANSPALFKSSVFSVLNRKDSNSGNRSSPSEPVSSSLASASSRKSFSSSMPAPNSKYLNTFTIASQNYNHPENANINNNNSAIVETASGNWKHYSPQTSPATKYLNVSPKFATAFHPSTSNGGQNYLESMEAKATGTRERGEFQLPSPIMNLPSTSGSSGSISLKSRSGSNSMLGFSGNIPQLQQPSSSASSTSTAMTFTVANQGKTNKPFKGNGSNTGSMGNGSHTFSPLLFSDSYMLFKQQPSGELFSLSPNSISTLLQTPKFDGSIGGGNSMFLVPGSSSSGSSSSSAVANSSNTNTSDQQHQQRQQDNEASSKNNDSDNNDKTHQDNERKEAGATLLQMKRNSSDSTRSSPVIIAFEGGANGNPNGGGQTQAQNGAGDDGAVDQKVFQGAQVHPGQAVLHRTSSISGPQITRSSSSSGDSAGSLNDQKKSLSKITSILN